MTTTMNTPDDFIQLLRDDPGFRRTVRREILTEDLGIASLFADRHSLPPDMIEIWQLGRNTLRDIVRDHEQELRSLNLEGEGALRSFRRPDLIAGVKHLAAEDDAEPEYYIAVEASYTIDEKDLVRATDNARIIRHVTGRPAYPVITGVQLKNGLDDDIRQKIFDDIEQFVQSGDPEAAYWHRLYSEDLRPDEAR